LIDGIGSMVGKVKDAIGSVVKTITDHLPWSPAKEGPLRLHPPEESGEKIGAMLAEGLEKSLPQLRATMKTGLTMQPFPTSSPSPAVGGGSTYTFHFEFGPGTTPEAVAAAKQAMTDPMMINNIVRAVRSGRR
jgi:hypothetical protein